MHATARSVLALAMATPPSIKEVLMGSGKGEMNLAAVRSAGLGSSSPGTMRRHGCPCRPGLASCRVSVGRGRELPRLTPPPNVPPNPLQVRSRAEELRRSMDQLGVALSLAADRVAWADALERFGVLCVQWAQLEPEVRPLLKHYVAHPVSVNQSNAAALPILLASRGLPDAEAADAALLEDLHARAATAHLPVDQQLSKIMVRARRCAGFGPCLGRRGCAAATFGVGGTGAARDGDGRRWGPAAAVQGPRLSLGVCRQAIQPGGPPRPTAPRSGATR